MDGTRTRLARLGRLLLLASLLMAAVVPAAMADEPANTKGFRKAVRVAGIRQHQAALQEIADDHGGTRLAGTPGYDASAQYVRNKAAAAGYSVSVQEFTFLLVADRTRPAFERVSPAPAAFINGVDFATMRYSGSGDVTAPLTAVDLRVPSPKASASTSGCDAADFAGFPAGTIALLQRGACNFYVMAHNARAAGAVGAIIFNEGVPDRTDIFIGRLDPPETLSSIPVVGTTFALGDALRNGVLDGPTGVIVRLRTDTVAEERTTRNVIAETPQGDPDHVVVIGAHLDTVSRGPGINDNGSGSATILDVAEVFAAQVREPRNKLRFIWFGAEELGLIGSEYYVDRLSPAERDRIELMLNFDMVGSPNFVRFVYDGNNSAFPAGPNVGAGPPGSGAIEQVFLDYFASLGLAVEPTPFSGRSDYGPFIAPAIGIPAGGLFTGAEGIKTQAQANTYGGTAGEPYDPCYHKACDDFDNTSKKALDQMSDAVAHAVLVFSKRNFDKEPLVDPAAPARPARASGVRTADAPHDHAHELEPR